MTATATSTMTTDERRAYQYLQSQFNGLAKVRESLLMKPERKGLANRMQIGYDRAFFLKVFNLFYVFCEPAPAGDFNAYDRYTVLMQTSIPELGAPVATGMIVTEVVRLINASAAFNEFPNLAQTIQVKDADQAETIKSFIQHLLENEPQVC